MSAVEDRAAITAALTGMRRDLSALDRAIVAEDWERAAEILYTVADKAHVAGAAAGRMESFGDTE